MLGRRDQEPRGRLSVRKPQGQPGRLCLERVSRLDWERWKEGKAWTQDAGCDRDREELGWVPEGSGQRSLKRQLEAGCATTLAKGNSLWSQ
jgi:hypothetical protein